MLLLEPADRLTVISGAGISAESGIPTFRGLEGYWTVGSKDYHPMQMATQQMFKQSPWEVWKWYLYRAGVCGQAKPNRGHDILVALEQQLQDRFLLITQNVDNLHIVAGNTPERTYQIHGNLFKMRCSRECRRKHYPLPESLWPRDKLAALTEDEKSLLTCPECQAMARPHVLWFDECYDEAYFKFESALRAAEETDVLLLLGTSGSTALPQQVANTVYKNGKTLIEISTEETNFTELTRASRNGKSLRKTCTEGLTDLINEL